MIRKALFLFACVLFFASCQFTETMVMQEDGSGRMSIVMDMSEMMAFGGMGEDTTTLKMDTIIDMRDFLQEKKDSIAQLSAAEQKQFKNLENFKMHMVADSDINKMFVDVFTDFTSVDQANDIMNGFSQVPNFIDNVGGAEVTKDEGSDQLIGVSYNFAKSRFVRDAYIADEARHTQQMDSIAQMEAFMSSMTYKIKYTFPRRIVSSSNENATYSLDGKTIELEASFIDYFKNPDVLDLEVELEN